ncbi:hypothetical protein MGMO_122c00020 [Methyloglobulus morosus KoM1]|uniref:Uncharacterized protein n=1 Tax=Methyloglobulus morosus KoM1 TaxID=1116472 RepID=V5BW25_9GAMM|nr:hypothetical protein [Methyloglobulus morosus]ESS70442.1 hypothetical protein MGMO_122c00020 [Methyloglobulus morosus KoM1]
MQDKRTEIVKLQGVVRTIPSHQQLVKTNRLLMGAVLFLMMLVLIVGIVFIPSSNIVERADKINVAHIVAQGMNPVVSTEVNNLKGQLIGLLSGSIESKLKALETSIKSGTVDNSLGTIADLKNDIKTLRTYSEPPNKPEAVVSNEQLAEEVTHLKHLIYASLTSCGLMFVAVAGVWVKYRSRLPYKDIKTGYLGRR